MTTTPKWLNNKNNNVMNRLDFLKKLLTGAAAMVVAPKLLANTEEKSHVEELKSAVPLPKTIEQDLDSKEVIIPDEPPVVIEEKEEFQDIEEFDDASTCTVSSNVSQPYILTIENKSTSTINNVQIFGAYENREKANYGNPTMVEITMGISGVTYGHMLAQSEHNPFITELTYIQSDNAKQVLERITVQHKDANGCTSQTPLLPILDPHQEDSHTICLKNQYSVDGGTTLIISRLLPFAKLNLYVYPLHKYPKRQILSGVKPVTLASINDSFKK